MILQRMTADALQRAKLTLPDVYWRYFTERTSDWMEQVWGPHVFEPFLEVPDFELSPVRAYTRLERGQLDIDNCIRVYDALRHHLTPAEASNEMLWAGICNRNFYSYMRTRWAYDKRSTYTDKDAGTIQARFLFGKRDSGMYRNTLAKCWWIPHLLYDSANAGDPYWRLRALGPSSFSTKVTDIFVNYGYSRNRTILDGVVRGVQKCRTQEIPIDDAMNVLRPALQYLNAVGGAVLLDALSPDEIADILVEGARGQTSEDTVYES